MLCKWGGVSCDKANHWNRRCLTCALVYAQCAYAVVALRPPESDMPAQAKAERVALRLAIADKTHLARAAKLQGRTLSDFMLAASREAADFALNEQTRFTLSAAALRKFTAALDAPAREIPALRKLFASPSVLEK